MAKLTEMSEIYISWASTWSRPLSPLSVLEFDIAAPFSSNTVTYNEYKLEMWLCYQNLCSLNSVFKIMKQTRRNYNLICFNIFLSVLIDENN